MQLSHDTQTRVRQQFIPAVRELRRALERARIHDDDRCSIREALTELSDVLEAVGDHLVDCPHFKSSTSHD